MEIAMFSILIKKELRAIIYSPKFTVTFAVCAVLMLLSVYIGINEYNQSVTQYRTARELAEQRMSETTAWPNLTNKAQREPNPLQIFAGGLNYDIGRWSLINRESSIKLKHTHYSDNPIYAVFRIIDFSFIVQFILTLFAVLFTFDAVNGEREKGTLQLVFSNPVSRAKFLLAKCAGSWLGLVIPISIPVLLSLLLVVIFKVPFDGGDWTKIISFLGLSLLLFSFFIVLGVLISTLIRRSNISFLTSLVIWVILVLIIPRAGVLAAGQMVYVPRVAEIEGQRDAFARDKWAQFQAKMENTWRERSVDSGGGCASADDEELWQWMKADDAARKKVEIEIEDYYAKLKDDFRRRKAVRERFAAAISRISPASAYQLAAMSLTDTDVALKTRYEDSMNSYRALFNDYVDKKAEEAGPAGQIMIKVSSEDGFDMSSFDSDQSLDLSALPRYQHPDRSFSESFSTAVIDFGILGIYSLLAFAGAFLRFLKYDIR
jgi:ABC-type transport system involved in multi-copper enzyme maturation permease subunit